MYMDTHSPQSSMMMERILLGVLYLSGWYVFSTCLLYQYHFVAEPMNWTEAQTYCREKYTDLATIENTEEMNHFVSTISSSDNSSDVWIGLYSKMWTSSDGYNGSGAEYRNWEAGHPYEHLFCVMIYTDHPWQTFLCSNSQPFICNNVNEAMNWSSAQKYCRENFRDLATVNNSTVDQQIRELSNVTRTWTWIGLFRDFGYWSDGGNSSFRNFYNDSMVNGSMAMTCGAAAYKRSGTWKLIPCGNKHPFVCYGIPPPPGTQKFLLVKETMNWFSAQRYCRENFINLATVRNDEENQEIQNFMKTYTPWIGLFRDTNIYWSDGSGSRFRYLYTSLPPNGSMSVRCGSVTSGKDPKMWLLACEGRYLFVCHSIDESPIKKQVVKVKIKSGDFVDLNDTAVKANILKEFQNRLKEKGVSGVTLKWREQPDGKVFHKEEKPPQKKKEQKTEL